MKTQFSSAVQLFKWNTAVINLKKKSSFLSFSRSVTWRHGFYIYPVALFGIVISDVLRKLNSIQFSLIVQQQPLLWNLIALRNAKKHKLLPEFKKKKKPPFAQCIRVEHAKQTKQFHIPNYRLSRADAVKQITVVRNHIFPEPGRRARTQRETAELNLPEGFKLDHNSSRLQKSPQQTPPNIVDFMHLRRV